MNTYDIEFVKLLPHFMREDAAIKGLAKGTEEVTKAIKAASSMLTTWDKVYQMGEEELDALAWELNILWYDKGALIDVKRDLILNSDKVYQRLGTKWAVENVINTYFGEGHIIEWFEYEGEPGHFKVLSSNPSITNENLTAFLNILSKVKRASAHLDGIQITLTGQMKLHIGVALHESSHDIIRLGRRQ